MSGRPTERVSAGEVCSIATAKKKGYYTKPFFSKTSYYNSEYSDVRTFSDLDKQKGLDSNAVCKQTEDGKEAYPMCPLVYGMPYVQDQKDPSKCVIDIKNFCPADRIRGNKCMRSNIFGPPPVPLNSRCDEKSTDWFSIPNYHLGNRYNFVQQDGAVSCMKPCPGDKVPGYVEDPVDGSAAGLTTNTEVSQCYEKTEYMNGKYMDTGNFCPAAWVYRLGLNEGALVNEITRGVNYSGLNKSIKKEAIKKAQSSAKQLYKDNRSMLENVEFPTRNMLAACSKLNTPERVKKAYGICKKIYDNPNSIKSMKTPYRTVLTNACHTMFCNEDDDLVSTLGVGKEPLCFSNLKKLNADTIRDNDTDYDMYKGNSAVLEKPPQTAYPNKIDSGKKATTRMLLAGVIIFVIVILVGALLFAWPLIKPFVLRVWCAVTYFFRSLFKRDYAEAKLNICMAKLKPSGAQIVPMPSPAGPVIQAPKRVTGPAAGPKPAAPAATGSAAAPAATGPAAAPAATGPAATGPAAAPST
jgi:hypothetical protein